MHICKMEYWSCWLLLEYIMFINRSQNINYIFVVFVNKPQTFYMGLKLSKAEFASDNFISDFVARSN